MKNILVFNVNWLGDVIFSTPVFRALRKSYPQARICCLAVPRVKEILECCPFIDEVLIYDERGRDRYLIGKIKLIFALRKKKFDAVFLMHGSWTRALMMFLAGIPVRVGYDIKKRAKLLTHPVGLPDYIPHRSDYYLRIIEEYGIPVHDRRCELSVPAQIIRESEQILSKHGINSGDAFVVVNPGGNWDLKRWPIDRWADVIGVLKRDLNKSVVITGANKDIKLAEEIAHLSGVNPVVLAGQTQVKQIVALMKLAQLVVSADSGPMHMAASVGTDVVAIFGPTRPEITGPRGRNRSIILQNEVECNREACYNLDCRDNICMSAVSSEEVVQQIKRILS